MEMNSTLGWDWSLPAADWVGNVANRNIAISNIEVIDLDTGKAVIFMLCIFKV